MRYKMKLIEMFKWPDGSITEDPSWHPSHKDVGRMWFSEKNKHTAGCDYCEKDAIYEIEMGILKPYDHYYHNTCKEHLFIRQCIRKDKDSPMFKCDFCNDTANYYIRTGESIDIVDKNFKEEIYKRRHFVCRKHVKIYKYSMLSSDWYSTYFRF